MTRCTLMVSTESLSLSAGPVGGIRRSSRNRLICAWPAAQRHSPSDALSSSYYSVQAKTHFPLIVGQNVVANDERKTKQGRQLIAACPTLAFSAPVLLNSNAVPSLQGRWGSSLETRFARNGLIDDTQVFFWFTPDLCHTRVAADVDRSTKNRHRNGWPHRSKLLARHGAEALRSHSTDTNQTLAAICELHVWPKTQLHGPIEFPNRRKFDVYRSAGCRCPSIVPTWIRSSAWRPSR